MLAIAGDAYMVASGVPDKMKHDHVREIASTALKQREVRFFFVYNVFSNKSLQFLFGYEIPHRPGQRLHCRWGFNSGSVFTGVVGVTAPRYCVFGSTVAFAAKMENSGQPDKIQMTLRSHQLLSERFPEYRSQPRGGVRIEVGFFFLRYTNLKRNSSFYRASARFYHFGCSMIVDKKEAIHSDSGLFDYRACNLNAINATIIFHNHEFWTLN